MNLIANVKNYVLSGYQSSELMSCENAIRQMVYKARPHYQAIRITRIFFLLEINVDC